MSNEKKHRPSACVALGLAMVLAARPAFGQARPAPPPLDTSASAPAASSPARSQPTKVPALAFGGVALVSAGVGLGFGAAALSAKSDFDREPTVRAADRAEGLMLVADVALGVAIVAGVTSLVLFLRGDEPSSREVGLLRF